MIRVVNMIPQSLSGNVGQDCEPNLTVNLKSPLQLVGTAFTLDPAGSSNAPLFVSSDGGDTWTLNTIVPGTASGVFPTFDITARFTASGELYVGVISAATEETEILRTNDAFGPGLMTLIDTWADGGLVDQPYTEGAMVMAGVDAGKDRLYVGANDFGAGSKTASVDVCLDARATTPSFARARLEARSTSGQDGPSVRCAIHPDGTVYAVFFRWYSGGADVVVTRDDNWASGATPFNNLLDAGDGLRGQRVATGINVNFNSSVGNTRVGSQLSVAVDPRRSSTLWVAWCDQQTGGYTLHVRRSTDSGQTWSGDLLSVGNVTNPAVAVSTRGKLGCLYQAVEGTGASQRWVTHFQRTADGLTWNDLVLCSAPEATPSPDPNYGTYLGDYTGLAAVGRTFHGIFAANNTPDSANFPSGVTFQRNVNLITHKLLAMDGVTEVPVSIDPFYFRVTEVEPVDDFYVRDWTDDATTHDDGAEPSIRPAFYVTSDVWNQRGTTVPNAFVSDQPANETPWSETLGTNDAYARITRRAPGAVGSSTDVLARFMYSEFGTGSNFQVAASFPGGSAEEHVTFVDTETVKISPAHAWNLPVTTSTHLCLAVEIASANDPMVTESLLGRAPGWPTTDLLVINDGNKAQRNMGVYPALLGPERWYSGVVHNGGLVRRDMVLRMDHVPGVGVSERQAMVEVHREDKKVDMVPFRQGGTVTLRDMEPAENVWVAIQLPGPTSGPVAVRFDELVDGTIVNGFAIASRPASLLEVIKENLRMHVSAYARKAALLEHGPCGDDAGLARTMLDRGDVNGRSYMKFLLDRHAHMLTAAVALSARFDLGDRLGLARLLSFGRLLFETDPISALATAHANYLHRLDAQLTMVQKAIGDLADVAQCARWQGSLYTSRAALRTGPEAASLRAAAGTYVTRYQGGDVSPNHFVAFLKNGLPGFEATATRLASSGTSIHREIAALRSALGDPTAAQRAHRQLLLALSRLP